MNIRRSCTRALLIGWLASLCCALPNAEAQIENFAQSAKPDPGLELLQDEPHDLVFFTQQSGGGWVKVHLLEFPDRRVPRNPSGSLKFEILGLEGKEFVALWSDIASVQLWENRLESEASQRLESGDFTGAYPFLSVLIRDFPQRDGLKDLRCDFLWQDAVSRARRGNLAPTLAVLEELQRFAPEYKTDAVIRAINRVSGELTTSLVDNGELGNAQNLLARLGKSYGADKLATVRQWETQFQDMAEEKLDSARIAFESGEFRTARELAQASISLQPDFASAKSMIQEIDRVYPMVRVGVIQRADALDPTSLVDWGARRSGRLAYRTLFELQQAGPEGGRYDFVLGRFESTPDRIEHEMILTPKPKGSPLARIQAFQVADALARMAQPESADYEPSWAALVDTVGIEGPKRVTFRLRRPHVSPASMLTIPIDAEWFGNDEQPYSGDYRPGELDRDVVRYSYIGPAEVDGGPAEVDRIGEDQATQPREVVEQYFESSGDSVTQLLQGKIDVVDRLFPADAVRLVQSSDVTVQAYALPTVHLLIPCSDHRQLSQPTFRRALVYGLDRQQILDDELLGGVSMGGCQVMSGPFPAGIRPNDPLGYGYDKAIKPRSFEPSLARLLMAMTEQNLRDAADGDEADSESLLDAFDDIAAIRLAHPADDQYRAACEAIAYQWSQLGLDVRLVELSPGRTFPEADDEPVDLVYVAAAIWEPVTDARRLLGPRGLARSTNRLVGLGLRRLEHARNWREVRDRLLSLHRIAHDQLPVIPLWQIAESYAYRNELSGVGTDIVSLYQNIQQWRRTR